MTRFDVTCRDCKFNKNKEDKKVAYRWAGFHEGEFGHEVEVSSNE